MYNTHMDKKLIGWTVVLMYSYSVDGANIQRGDTIARIYFKKDQRSSMMQAVDAYIEQGNYFKIEPELVPAELVPEQSMPLWWNR